MSEALRAYVASALRQQGFALNDAAVQEVSLQFERIAATAQSLLEIDLPLDAEQAGIFHP